MLPKTTWMITGRLMLSAFFLLGAMSIANADDGHNSLYIIGEAYRNGEIDRSEMLFEQMKAIFAPQDLSAEFKSSTPSFIKSATELVMQVQDNWDDFSPEQQSLLAGYMGRPDMELEFDSPDGYFKIHYDTIGYEPVPPEDVDGDDVPDYVERIAEYCDSSYRAYSDMGYLPAPSDHGDGGDDKYDIYLISISAYGATFPDGTGDSAWNDARSHIGIHYSFNIPWLGPNDDPEGDTIGAQKVTCAHEFFHAIQLAYVYNAAEFLWMMETTATWMEEVIYPEVNDNYNYLASFFNAPHHGINYGSGYHMYGGFVWGAYLEQKFDYTVIRSCWEASRYNMSLDATDSALAFFGVDLLDVSLEFALWNYFTGERAIPGMYYIDAADYPLVHIDQTFPTLVQGPIQPIDGPDGLACNYVQFTVDTSSRGILEILLEGSDLVRWGNIGVFSDGGIDSVIIQSSDGMYPVQIFLPFIEDYGMVTAVPTVVSRYLTNNGYDLSCMLIPYGDANYDWETNVGDATYLINYVFYGDSAPKPILETGDANCDGGVNVADAVTIINYVFKGGDEPCANRVPQ